MTHRNTKSSEPTISTKTLRSHPWHDVHGITHRQMAEKPAAGGRIQFLTNGVRAVQPDLSTELIAKHWGKSREWLASAIGSCDPFQRAELLQHYTRLEALEQAMARR